MVKGEAVCSQRNVAVKAATQASEKVESALEGTYKFTSLCLSYAKRYGGTSHVPL